MPLFKCAVLRNLFSKKLNFQIYLFFKHIHPRSRRENLIIVLYPSNILGSPPLTRGILWSFDTNSGSRRFTPAGAGNTMKVQQVTERQQVHPRWRGEYLPSRIAFTISVGSPPLARGIPMYKYLKRQEARFTPAGAGNTKIIRLRWHFKQVHPRWRGEYFR